jgi:SAM-dependent methyltransferase
MTYVKLYDEVFSYQKLYQTDFENIKNSISRRFLSGENKESLHILDAGTGPGKHFQLFDQWIKSEHPTWKLDSVELSESFSKLAKMKNPDGNIITGNLINPELFPAQSFDVIMCLYDTIHHNTLDQQDKIYENFYYWLKPTGILYIHFFNGRTLDPAPCDFSQYYDHNHGDDLGVKKHSQTNFEKFVHDAYWVKMKNENSYQYIEQYILPNGKKKIKTHNFTIVDRGQSISRLKYYGFMPVDIIDMKSIGAEMIDLFIFEKKKL